MTGIGLVEGESTEVVKPVEDLTAEPFVIGVIARVVEKLQVYRPSS
jgi:hypothetical protein